MILCRNCRNTNHCEPLLSCLYCKGKWAAFTLKVTPLRQQQQQNTIAQPHVRIWYLQFQSTHFQFHVRLIVLLFCSKDITDRITGLKIISSEMIRSIPTTKSVLLECKSFYYSDKFHSFLLFNLRSSTKLKRITKS